MKNIIMLFLVIAFCSCNKKPVIETKIAEYIKANAHNPETYEPIETKLISTTYMVEKLKLDLISLKETIESDTRSIKKYKKSWLSLDFEKERLIKSRREFEEKKNILDSIKYSKNTNPIESITFSHKCRINVPLGGKMLKEFVVMTDKDYNIIYFIEGK